MFDFYSQAVQHTRFVASQLHETPQTWPDVVGQCRDNDIADHLHPASPENPSSRSAGLTTRIRLWCLSFWRRPAGREWGVPSYSQVSIIRRAIDESTSNPAGDD